MFLSNLSIRRPVLAAVLMLALVTLGITSYRRLAIDMFPNIEIPVITIVTVYPGASPETIEREVTKPIEEAVHPVAGVKHVGSVSREGVSQVWVEFELEVKADQAAQDARSKIAAIRGALPQQIEEPVIDKLDFAALPVVSLAVRSTTLSPRDLTTLVDKKVKRRLENISGVGRVDLVGAATREVEVEVDPARLESLGMGVDEVLAGIRTENVDTPLGRLLRGGTEFPVRVQGKARQVEDLRKMVVAHRRGRPVTLDEVATVTDGVEEQRSLAFVDGEPAIGLDIMKQTGANTVGVVDAIKAALAPLQQELPAGTHVTMVQDSSIFIRDSVEDVQQTMVLGAIFTVLIVFCFLNSWRSTVITGLTLPISVISSFIAMNFLGMTLNMMTLMALSLAIGLLIDDAIVVRENIVRHLERGQDHFEAAREGTSEIGLAVMATSFSIVSVFVPVAFMKGIVGRFFFHFGLTVAFAVLVSLFVSFTLDPMLSSRWYDPDIERKGHRNPVARALDLFNAWFDRTADRYRGAIGWALDHRKAVLGIAGGAFVAGLLVFGLLPSEFLPRSDQGGFDVKFKTAPDASIAETRNRLGAVLDVVRKMPELDHTYATIGAGDAGTVRDARVYVALVDRSRRDRAQAEIQRAVRARLGDVPGIVGTVWEAGSMDSRKPLLVDVRGEDLARLKGYAARMKDSLYGVPGVVDLEMTLEHDTREYRLLVDRTKAGDAGLNTGVIASTLAALVEGQVVSTFDDEEGEARDVRVRLPAPLREGARQLDTLRFAVRGGGAPTLVPLGGVATWTSGNTPTEINRMDLMRQVEVSANLDGLPLGNAVAAVRRAAEDLQLEPGYRVVLSGENEAMEESFAYMGEALVLAVILVYLILAAQFESFVDPLAIMLSLPLAVVGMAGTLLLTRDALSIMSLIGLIMLMGLVTKNAILLVDFAKVLRRRGVDRRSALIEAGRIRLRPIVMTTAAMVFGMLPLALGLGAGAEFRAPMARAIIGGLITSTLLTLIVVPVVYTLLDDAMAVVRGRWARHNGHKAAAAVAAFLLVAGAAVAAGAGEPASPPRVLTLEQALAAAASKNRDVQSAREYRSWVRGKYWEERASALPQVNASASLMRQSDQSQRALFGEFASLFPFEQDLGSVALSVSQPVFTWGKVGASVKAAREGVAYAEDELDRARQAVARDVTTAFDDVLLARELRQAAAEEVAQRERHLEEARRKFDTGTATDYDVLAAEVALENARPDLIRAENGARTARQRLAFLLAEEAGEVDAEGTLEGAVEDAPRYEDLLPAALERRPEIRSMVHQRGVYRQLVTIATADTRPRVDFNASWGHRSFWLENRDSRGKLWQAAFSLSVPLFDGMRGLGRIKQAKSDLARADLAEAKLREAVSLELRVAGSAVQEAAEIVKALTGTVSQAERVLLMAEKGYEFGVKTRLDVEDAQLGLTRARTRLAQARRDYRVARANLGYASGTLELPPP